MVLKPPTKKVNTSVVSTTQVDLEMVRLPVGGSATALQGINVGKEIMEGNTNAPLSTKSVTSTESGKQNADATSTKSETHALSSSMSRRNLLKCTNDSGSSQDHCRTTKDPDRTQTTKNCNQRTSISRTTKKSNLDSNIFRQPAEDSDRTQTLKDSDEFDCNSFTGTKESGTMDSDSYSRGSINSGTNDSISFPVDILSTGAKIAMPMSTMAAHASNTMTTAPTSRSLKDSLSQNGHASKARFTKSSYEKLQANSDSTLQQTQPRSNLTSWEMKGSTTDSVNICCTI